MYSIKYTEEALADLAYLRKHERRLITDTVDRQLVSEPTIETNNRKRLRPNQIAEWQLRIGKYRVFYDVIEKNSVEMVKIVKIVAVGYKQHNRLFFRGKEFQL